MEDSNDDVLLAPSSALVSDAIPEDDEAGIGDGSTSDSKGIVRIWTSDDRITKVRVSTQWHSRLGRRTLDDCFTQALLAANLRVSQVVPEEPVSAEDVDASLLPPFSQRAFAAFAIAFDDVEQRWDQALERHRDRQPQPRPLISGKSKGVMVFLNDAGVADTVTFDGEWLDTAQAGDICNHVVRAAENAYALFTPVEEDRGELDEIQAEHQFMVAAFKAMLNPKERS